MLEAALETAIVTVPKTWALFNHRAGTASAADSVREQLLARPNLSLAEPDDPAEIANLVADALVEGTERIIAAGGDGTLHQVLKALAPHFDRVSLAVVPIGTGNDLRRTLSIPDDPHEALALVDTDHERSLDVIAVDTPAGRTYSLNVISGGFSGQLREALTDEIKAAWGPLAYIRGAAGVLTDLTKYHCRFTFDDADVMEFDALNVIVANGRYAARGWQVASQANPEDGLLDVVVVRDAAMPIICSMAAQLVAGDYQQSDAVFHRRARSVRIESDPPMSWSVDGEPAEGTPAMFTVLPGVLRMIVGPDYRPDVDAV